MSEAAIRLHVERLEEGGFLATSPDVPGLVAEGRTITETVEIAQGLARKILESCLDHGDEIPAALMKMVDEGVSPTDFTIPVPVR
ncbi:MAG: type II toxin-antitoxin system HicB family antitoxin [Nitrospinae bacterium]|nr:type II toxin-antitoxin system HicB family antitoxin [Nitrospinota bacterium]